MPSTTISSTDLSIRNMGARTNSAGTGITDLTAEEDRFSHIVLAGGIVTPADGFVPAKGAGATMNVLIGSGTAKDDYAIVKGTSAGQGNYMVRLEAATQTLTLSAADPTNGRIDEIYIVVQDDAYDASSRGRGALAIREGDPGAEPSAPGPDGAWDAYLLIAAISVPAAAADILATTLTDSRVQTQLYLGEAGRLYVGSDPNDTVINAKTGGEVLMAVNGTAEARFSATGLDMAANSISNVGTVDGVDVANHSHDGTADDGPQLAHSGLSGLTTGDPHTQYVLESDHTKAAHDALGIAAATAAAWTTGRTITLTGDVSGVSAAWDGSSNISISTTVANDSHTHATQYLGLSATAAAATKLATARNIALGGDLSGSANFDGTGNITITATVADDSHNHIVANVDGLQTDLNDKLDAGSHATAGASVTASTLAPSGGVNGDIWLQY